MTLDAVDAVQIVTWGGDQWVSFDNAETFALKISFANSQCLGGYVIYLRRIPESDAQG
jgi:chitinase